ncbi:MAG: glycine cleavage system aminomethyltransferase GcvT [Firmicutes bacterium]|nr:glycine cleavage system aminomethyltransferase GcvT [Bacillota bacterium]
MIENGYMHSPLESFHIAHHAKMVPFAGWLMPLSYESERTEHTAVRSKAALFDLSHMGEIVVEGKEASSYLNYHLVSDIGSIEVGRAKYTLCCEPDGSVLEDLIVYRIEDNAYLLIVNASNTHVMAERFSGQHGFDVVAENVSQKYALIALQGPLALKILGTLTDEALPDMKYYSIVQINIRGIQCYIARTGYTGEDGFEILCTVESAETIAELLYSPYGNEESVMLAGLAARDSLRLEAGMALYGNELSREVNPFEAGLGRLVAFSKPETFVGKDALYALKDSEPEKSLVGFEVDSGRPARHGYVVLSPDSLPAGDSIPKDDEDPRTVGVVTSGAVSPTLHKSIGMAYIQKDFCSEGQRIFIKVRDKQESAKIVKLPFYTRKRV